MRPGVLIMNSKLPWGPHWVNLENLRGKGDSESYPHVQCRVESQARALDLQTCSLTADPAGIRMEQCWYRVEVVMKRREKKNYIGWRCGVEMELGSF